MRFVVALLALSTIPLPDQCARRKDTPSVAGGRIPASPIPHSPKEALRGPVRMERLETDASAPTFVMRGGPHGPGRLVFLHGVCAHALGYAQSFQWSAATKGTLIAPQGDVACG